MVAGAAVGAAGRGGGEVCAASVNVEVVTSLQGGCGWFKGRVRGFECMGEKLKSGLEDQAM